MMTGVADHAVTAALLGAFAEYIGIPVPSGILLLYLGAVAAPSWSAAAVLIGASVLGAVLADTAWFAVGRRHGERLLHVYCTVSLGSRTCTSRTEAFFRRLGLRALLIAKLVPGLSTFAAPMAGRIGTPWRRFWLWDAAGAFLWAAPLLVVGRLVGRAGVAAVGDGVRDVGGMLATVLIVTAVLVLAMKWIRRARHGRPDESVLASPAVEP